MMRLVGSAPSRTGVAFVGVFVLVSGLIVFMPTLPASAASNGQWSVFPTAPPGQGPRAFVKPLLTPGKPYADSVTVTNYTAAPLSFNVYASDAVNTTGGGLSLRPRTAVQRDIGSWIHLTYSKLRVPAHSATVVPFTIDPPQQATPGDHVGGIVAEDTQGTASRSGSVPITVVQAVGVRVYGRVLGPLHPALALPQMTLSAHESVGTQFSSSVDARVMFTVRNAGNTVLSPVGTVVLTTPFGTPARRRFIVNQILPGSSLHYALNFSGISTYGRLKARVSLNGQGARGNRVSTVWTVPWALLGLIVLVLALGLWLVARRRRKRRSDIESQTTKDLESVNA